MFSHFFIKKFIDDQPIRYKKNMTFLASHEYKP